MAKFKNRLRELRESRGLSQQKVAELVGVSDTAYQRYEYGERDLPGKTLLELVKVYDCTVDEILGASYSYAAVELPAPGESELLEFYRASSKKGQKMIAEYAAMVAERHPAKPAE